jgi:hypothetical protein
MECSSAKKIIDANTFNKPRDLVNDYIFYNMSYRKNFAHHLFQYKVWKKSMQAKFLTEGLFLVILIILTQFYLVEALNSGHELLTVYTEVTDLTTDQDAIDAALEEHHTAAIQFYDNMEITLYLSFIALFYLVRIVLEMLYSAKINKPLKFLTFTNFLDFTFSLMFLIRIGREYDKYQTGLSSISDHGAKGIRYFENIYEFNDDEIMLDVVYAIAMSCLWIRVLFMFRMTRFLGPLLKMIYMMVFDIGIFMVLFTILLIIYASMAVLLFYTETGYTNFWDSMVTLFGSALGNFNFTSLDGSNKGQVVGEIYLISFIILCNILILNLLIAILSSTYALLEDKKLVLYINEILKLRASLEYDNRASGMVSTFPPWNFFPLILSPFHFILTDTVAFNEVVCHICYVPVMVVITIVFIVLNIFLIPLAYMKGIFTKAQFLFSSKLEKSVSKRILMFF